MERSRPNHVGFTEEEALGQPLTILMPAPYVVSHQKGFERFLTTGESRVIGSTVELDGLRKDGSEFPIGLSLSTWKVGDENYFAAIIRDITERKRAEEALQHRVEFERLITTLSTHFINLVPDEVDSEINHALQTIGEFADVDRSYVFLFSDNGTKMDNTHEWCAEGIEPQIDNLQGLPVEVLPWWVDKLNRFETIHIPRVADLPPEARAEKEILQAQDIQSLIVVPLVYGGSLIGFLGFDSVRAERTWSEDIIVLLRIVGEVIANALEHKRADEELQDSLEKLREALGGIIQTVALTVETKDPYTAGHQRRVGNLARAIATEMGLPPEQIEGIRMAGGIHDLGKINIPADILSKPTRLSDFEWGIIKMHSQTGYDILKTVDFPWPVAQIVLQHHERLDGSGYPRGLSGEEIILEARILGVADVVEAMASFRPYRPARGLDKALEEISQNKGILYDHEVVDACLRLFTEEGFTFDATPSPDFAKPA